jgi:IclR family transcriptional regulator, KDG regulon repressor
MSEVSQTLERIVSIMDCFTLEQPELGVREVARMVDLSASTTGRLLASLRQMGILNQNPETRAYALGGKVLAWAGVYSATLDVRNQAQPFIHELHELTSETISLYVLEGDERLCIERLESPHSVRIVARIGRRLPLYAGSAGKVFLAFLPEQRREAILDATEMRALTPNTITDRQKLYSELEVIRQQGYAISCGEWILEASGVAAPVFDQMGEILSVLTISGPTQRFTEEIIAKYVSVVTRVASQISLEMGGSVPVRAVH